MNQDAIRDAAERPGEWKCLAPSAFTVIIRRGVKGAYSSVDAVRYGPEMEDQEISGRCYGSSWVRVEPPRQPEMLYVHHEFRPHRDLRSWDFQVSEGSDEAYVAVWSEDGILLGQWLIGAVREGGMVNVPFLK